MFCKNLWNLTLNYVDDIETVLNLRVVFRTVDNILQSWHFTQDEIGFGKRTMVCFGKCTHCHVAVNETNSTIIESPIHFEPKPIYVLCKRWQCFLATIIALQYEAKKSNIRILVKPIPLEQPFRIPRSDPTLNTLAYCPFNIVFKASHGTKWLLFCAWIEYNNQLQKGVYADYFDITDDWIYNNTLYLGSTHDYVYQVLSKALPSSAGKRPENG